MVDIEGVSTLADFEVIEIVNDSNPYLALLGIDWATDMNEVINMKKRKMIFEKKSLRVVVPLDPEEGSRYMEPVRDNKSDDDLECIYKITAREQDWVNTTDDRILWERKSSCTSNSDEEIERWQNRLHEVTTINYNMMVKSLRCVTTEVRDLPMYNRLTAVDEFLNNFEREVLEKQHFDALKWALRATPARWWGVHQRRFEDWYGCKRIMCRRFGKLQMW